MIDEEKIFQFDEFADKEEIEEFQEFFSGIWEEIIAEESAPALLNISRIKEMEFCEEALKYITKGIDAVITYKLHEPFKSMGSISVTAKNLVFEKSKWFSRIMDLASNMEVYALSDGGVKLTFTFHNITIGG